MKAEEDSDEKRYSVGCSDGVVRVVDFEKINETKEVSLYGQPSSICCLMHDTNSDYVALAL